MNKLLIATNNQGKVKELQELLKDTGIHLITPAELNLDLDVHEDGSTYAENAAKKANAFARVSGLISLADDSGLEVDALGGAPGLFSARYGSNNGEKLSDASRRQYLLQNLKGEPRPWRARFHATIAVAIPESLWRQMARRLNLQGQTPVPQMFEGYCQGEIIPEERGTGGFGYDPIFFLPELGKTMAELSVDEKNRLSHRARAVMNGKYFLKQLFSE